jgi:hypothetical protein
MATNRCVGYLYYTMQCKTGRLLVLGEPTAVLLIKETENIGNTSPCSYTEYFWYFVLLCRFIAFTYLRFKIITAVKMSMFFWVVTSCGVVCLPMFRRNALLRLQDLSHEDGGNIFVRNVSIYIRYTRYSNTADEHRYVASPAGRVKASHV